MNSTANLNTAPPLPVTGFTAAGIACGIKKRGGRDLMVLASDRPATVAGVFTTNVVQAAPVTLAREVVTGGVCHAVVANSGCANACTGAQGRADAAEMATLTADALGVPSGTVAVASTGVIGVPLPMASLRNGIPKAVAVLDAGGWEAAADAIRTTDTVPKWHSATTEIGGTPVTVTGIAKGSGMIHPNMATMLGFLATDAAVAPDALQNALSRAVAETFNRITVDGDTSTNDAVLLLANGAAGGTSIEAGTPQWEAFTALVASVCEALAAAIVTDGEGATKRVTIAVQGAATEADALAIARQVATSNLVKTALFGADPNWGRIFSAAGQAGIPFDPEAVSLRFGPHPLVERGAHLGPEAERAAAAVMKEDAYAITVILAEGSATASYLTCDLTDGYVRINADYRS